MAAERQIVHTALTSAASLLRVRWLVRVPVHLYRARLGFVFGSRLVMLEHIGRKSGTRRYAVLEVVARPTAGSYVVASGFGGRAQWFRNVRADPRVRVQVGGRRLRPATARLLTAEEAKPVLAAYAAKHPMAWRTLRPVFETTLGAAIAEDVTTATTATTLPLVSLDLR